MNRRPQIHVASSKHQLSATVMQEQDKVNAAPSNKKQQHSRTTRGAHLLSVLDQLKESQVLPVDLNLS